MSSSPGRGFLAGRRPEDDPTHLQMFSAADVRRLLAEHLADGLDLLRVGLVATVSALATNLTNASDLCVLS